MTHTADTHWLSAVVESLDDAIVTETLDGTIMSWNSAAERLLGYPAREMIGEPIARITPPDRLYEEQTWLERMARGEHVEPQETLRIHKDGQAITVELCLSPIQKPDGPVIGAVARIRLVSAHRHTDILEDQRHRWIEGILRGLGGGIIAVD